ncbi:hypothetical protein JX265_009542 [Neoarthrinium moseri]|uniref:ABC transporter domain-containing protein n=1 Tax=Neoarthrinium moseri TaxID=1658444 RepID=A0A9P9WFT9_9PEZI|nr:hypothetical protein JX265_009542 [Neoarthrinium moseri]
MASYTVADQTTAFQGFARRAFTQEKRYPVASSPSSRDMEQGSVTEAHLLNTTVESISWYGVTVAVKDRQSKSPRSLVENVEGIVRAGELCALMGPSGSGKTTLLNVLAHRETNAKTVDSTVLVNGLKMPLSTFRKISCFVEQEDALIGSLTVRETLSFASRLSTDTKSLPVKDRVARIDSLLEAFGLREQADTLIGTPIRKGISGGQKRRVGVASQLITGPKILFLDEPTSGLDSTASYEVISYLKWVAKRNNLIVIASIHQPSTSTFNLFDKLLLLSKGKTHYFGPVPLVRQYYAQLGQTIPLEMNTAEYLLELVNTDFASSRGFAPEQVEYLQRAWEASPQCAGARYEMAAVTFDCGKIVLDEAHQKPSVPSVIMTLLHRSLIKSYRDVVAYGIRIAMYLGLAIMMGTVWVRMDTDQSSIQPFTNGLFFGSAFMSFMAVAYVPAFLEDRLQYVKEHHNGLYGATELIISNFLIGIPYLFIISLLFSAISYWLINFRPSAPAFFTYLMWLFLDLLAAESLVVFFTSLFPSFVISLALVAFANGLWMSVGGFLVSPDILNVFYKYVFHYWDYQKWVFEGMMVNEFADRVYDCAQVPGGGCHCMYSTKLEQQCLIQGQGVLDQYGYRPGHMGRNVGILMAIVVGYRVAAWVVLTLRR